MLWEWRGIANMDFIQLGGSSRVDEMILARVRSGFAGEKVWGDIQVVLRFGAGKKTFWGRRQFGPLNTVMSTGGTIVASHEDVMGFFAKNTTSNNLIRIDNKQKGIFPEIMLHVFEEFSFLLG
ncbi:hypothetical protein Tco_1247331 [Tanacetum coccineum]